MSLFCTLGNNPVNAPQVDWALQPTLQCLIAKIGRDVNPVLNNAAIHIYDVQSAVRPVRNIHGTKAFITRSEKLLFRESVGRRDDALLFVKEFAPHNVSCGFAQKGCSIESLGKRVTTINAGAARASESSERAVCAKLAFLVAAVHTGIHPRRKDRVALFQLDISTEWRFE